MTHAQVPPAAERVAAELRALRAAAGNPTLEALARRTGISKSVLSDAFVGKKLPTPRTVTGLVQALGGDVDHVLALREPARASAASAGAGADGPAGPDASADADAGAGAGASAPATEPGTPAPTTRTVRLSTFVLVAAVAAVGGVALGAVGATAVHLGGGSAATAAARQDGQQASPAATSGGTGPSIVVATGEDPANTRCLDDAAVAASETRTHDTLLEIVWSDACQAGWARITRYDGKAAGNEVSASIFREVAPDAPDRQDTTEPGVQGAYTTLLVRPTPDTRICATGEITVDGRHIDLGSPVCL